MNAPPWNRCRNRREVPRSRARCYTLLLLLAPGALLPGCADDEPPPQDSGVPPADASQPPADASRPPPDAADAAPIPVDGGGNDASPPDGTPPTVLSATPEPGATGVANDVAIAVTFDEAIDPDSVDAASFRLVDIQHDRAVAGSAIVDGAVVRFEPAAELTFRERYELVIGTAVTDLSGTPLAEEWRGAFTVREGVLGSESVLTTGTAVAPAMDMGGRGEAFALWWDADDIYSRHYQAPAGWGSAELVSYTAAPSTMAVAAGLDDAALAVWEIGATRESASYVNDVVAWLAVPMLGGGTPAQVGVDARGFGLAAWLQDTGTHLGVAASRFSGAQWSNPVRLDEVTAPASSLQLAVDDEGNGVALWAQDQQIWAAQFRDGGWQPAAVLDPSSAREPRLVLDGDGRGMAFWLQQDGAQYRMRWSSYEPGAGFSPPASADGGPAIDLDRGDWRGALAFNSHGDAVVVWSELIGCGGGESCNVLFANRFTLQGGWQETEAVSDAYTQFGFRELHAAIDRHGSALAAWTVNAASASLELWLRRYVPGQGWEQASPRSCAAGQGFEELGLLVSPQGRMLMTWSERSDTPARALCALVLD
jgi:hypothetical protein